MAGNKSTRFTWEDIEQLLKYLSPKPVIPSGTALARLPLSFSNFFSFSSSLKVLALADPPQKIGVAMAPGEMALTRI
ncbi:MAG: hypothetical protein CM1200mP12_06960 [Gammaproteobacteria bacterium]|nr:MAG: hypothetical protein CM1200mP12_06960 [Gammaproteobacteria bacterium]